MIKLSDRNKSWIGKLILLTITIIWGSSFVILKDTLSNLDGKFTFFILFFRFSVATLLIFLIFPKRMLKINKVGIKKGVVLGLQLFFAYAVQTIGLNYTTPSKNAFLTVTYCILVPFMSWIFLKKRPELKNYIAALLCLVGVAFVALIGKNETGKNELLGDIITLGCGIFYALQMIFISKYMVDEDPLQLLFIELLVCSIACAIVTATMEFPINYKYFYLSFDATVNILYLAVFATFFAQLGQMIGQKFTSPTSASLILSLETVFGVVFDLLIGGTKLTIYIIIGFIIIFIAEIINEFNFDKIKSLIITRKKK